MHRVERESPNALDHAEVRILPSQNLGGGNLYVILPANYRHEGLFPKLAR